MTFEDVRKLAIELYQKENANRKWILEDEQTRSDYYHRARTVALTLGDLKDARERKGPTVVEPSS